MIDIYPAIDIYNGEAVSLTEGKIENKQGFGDPIAFAKTFSKISGKLHIVDLNGAFTGIASNFDIALKIRNESNAFIQLGGGFRNIEAVKKALNSGINSIILGTASLNDNLMEEICPLHRNITISIDSYNGKIKYNGWNSQSNMEYTELFNNLRNKFDRFIFTSVKNDGTGSIAKIKRFWDDEYIIYAGGVNSINDIKCLEKTGFSGVIIGKALYNKTIKMEELKCLQSE